MNQTITLRTSRLSVIQAEPADEAPATMRFLDMLPDANPAAGFGLLGGTVSRALLPMLEALRDSLIRAAAEGASRIFRLDHLAAPMLADLRDVLGPGEVRGITRTPQGEQVQFQESVVTGIWWVDVLRKDGTVLGTYLEVGDIPGAVRLAARSVSPSIEIPTELPPGLMNAAPLLTEIAHEMKKESRNSNHVISFTLLPMNTEDMKLLERTLGPGPIAIESRGYGTCVVQATGASRVWSVQHRNVMGEVVLDTLEIGDVPDGVLAATEDFEDSVTRIDELLEDAGS